MKLINPYDTIVLIHLSRLRPVSLIPNRENQLCCKQHLNFYFIIYDEWMCLKSVKFLFMSIEIITWMLASALRLEVDVSLYCITAVPLFKRILLRGKNRQDAGTYLSGLIIHHTMSTHYESSLLWSPLLRIQTTCGFVQNKFYEAAFIERWYEKGIQLKYFKWNIQIFLCSSVLVSLLKLKVRDWVWGIHIFSFHYLYVRPPRVASCFYSFFGLD